MKMVIIFLMLLILSIAVFSQETTSSQSLTKEDYLTKSRHQKTAAWILLGGGVAMFAIAAPGNVSFDALGVLVVVGTVATLSSIPLFIARDATKERQGTLQHILNWKKPWSFHKEVLLLNHIPLFQ